MEMYILRAYKTEYYNDSDEGEIQIGTFYRDIEFSLFRDKLQVKADELNRGFGFGVSWTLERQEELRALDSQYDCWVSGEYRVDCVTLEIE